MPGSTFEDFTIRGKPCGIGDGLEATQAWLAKDGAPILILAGGTGVGKTHLARAAYRELCLTGDEHEVRFFTDGGLMDEIYASFGQGSHRGLLREVELLPWMVVDDFGVSALSETMLGVMERIVDLRWQGAERGRRTLITTNLAATRFSTRIQSRLGDLVWSRRVTMTGPDHRRLPRRPHS